MHACSNHAAAAQASRVRMIDTYVLLAGHAPCRMIRVPVAPIAAMLKVGPSGQQQKNQADRTEYWDRTWDLLNVGHVGLPITASTNWPPPCHTAPPYPLLHALPQTTLDTPASQ